MQKIQVNVFGEEIKECSCSPMTGFFRTGCCETSATHERALEYIDFNDLKRYAVDIT